MWSRHALWNGAPSKRQSHLIECCEEMKPEAYRRNLLDLGIGWHLRIGERTVHYPARSEGSELPGTCISHFEPMTG
jgi:hypothetical protein